MGSAAQPIAPDPVLDALRVRHDAARAKRLQPAGSPLTASDEQTTLAQRLEQLRRQRAGQDWEGAKALAGARASLAQPVAADVTAVDRSALPAAPPPPPSIRGVTPGKAHTGDVGQRLEQEAAGRGRLRALIPGAGPAAYVERAVGRALAHGPGAIGEFGARTAALGEEHQ